MQVLVGHLAKSTGRAKGTVGLQGHVFAQGVSRGHEAAERVKGAGLGPARIGHIPYQRAGRGTIQHVAVERLRADIDQGAELQLRPAEL